MPEQATAVVEQYLAAVGSHDAEGAGALLAPASPLNDDPLIGLAEIRDVTVGADSLGAPEGTSALLEVNAWVEGESDSTWGPGEDHTFFVAVTELGDGSWRVDHTATSP